MGSSRSTRNTLRATAGSEIAGTSVGTFFPASAIPIKFTQALGAFGMLFHESEGSLRDRGLLLFQGVLASTQLVLASILFFDHTTCDSKSTESMCVASFYLMLVYHGTLLTGWGLSEMLRQPPCCEIAGSGGGTLGDGSVHSIVHIPHPPTAARTNSLLIGRDLAFAQRNQLPSIHQDRNLSPTQADDDEPEQVSSRAHTVVSIPNATSSM